MGWLAEYLIIIYERTRRLLQATVVEFQRLRYCQINSPPIGYVKDTTVIQVQKLLIYIFTWCSRLVVNYEFSGFYGF